MKHLLSAYFQIDAWTRGECDDGINPHGGMADGNGNGGCIGL